MNSKALEPPVELLFFWGSWCPVCKQMEQILHHIIDVPIIKINVDRHPTIASTYNVLGTPTWILLDKHNNEIRRTTGAVSTQHLQQFIDGDNI